MDTKICSECGSDIPRPAHVCCYCTSRIEGIQCPACASYCPNEARLCRCCGSTLQTQASELDIEEETFAASTAGCLLLRFSLLPQTATFNKNGITVRTPAFFGLTRSTEDIPPEKVAGFQHREGLVWDAITIETRGQSNAMLLALDKEQAKEMAALLRRINQ